MPNILSKRYGKALVGMCASSAEKTAVGQELSRFTNAYENSAELRQVTESPAFSIDDKKATLAAVSKALKLTKQVEYFLNFLLERERLGLISDIQSDFQQRIDAEAGRVHVEVTTAVEMSAAEKSRTEAALKKLTEAKEIVVDCKVDPAVLGGVVTRIGNTVLDTSIQSQIENMRGHLLAD